VRAFQFLLNSDTISASDAAQSSLVEHMLAFIPWGYLLRRRLDQGKPLSTAEKLFVGVFCGVVFVFGLGATATVLSSDSVTAVEKWIIFGFLLLVTAFGAVGALGACLGWLDREVELPGLRKDKLRTAEKGIALTIAEEFFGSETFETKLKELENKKAKSVIIRPLQAAPVQAAKPYLNDSPKMSWHKKQLFVLLAVASWITLIIIWALLPIHYYDNSGVIGESGGYSDLGVDWLKSYGIACALPAVVFGGVLFWWFGKSRDRS